ncbi:hypothetical protein GCK32_001349 [Trichostrongylus colubriformis]|uniref:Transmembrane protein n=1 Tax=Trichostrongylus colubriformis TaxID=6319 RepID=A0AAN8IQK6_TRICO
MSTGVITVLAMALSAHAIYCYQTDPSWWMYVPAYGIASIVCIWPLPSLTIWRILSSIAVIGGGTLMLFLMWTFRSLESAAGLELPEAKNLLPVAIGVALTGSTRLMSDTRGGLFRYPRYFILSTILISSILTAAYSVKYYLK